MSGKKKRQSRKSGRANISDETRRTSNKSAVKKRRSLSSSAGSSADSVRQSDDKVNELSADPPTASTSSEIADDLCNCDTAAPASATGSAERKLLWNEKTEMMMRTIAHLSHSQHLAHMDMFSIYQMKHKIIVNIVTALGIIVSAGIFGSAPYCEEVLWVQIVTGVINIIATYFARYQAMSDYATSAQLHRYTSAKWNALYRNIDSQLNYNPENRQDAKDYITWINAIYSDLCENSPDIAHKIRKKYKLTGADQIKISNP